MKREVASCVAVGVLVFCIGSPAKGAELTGHLLVYTRTPDANQTFWSIDPATGAKTKHGTAYINWPNNGMGFSGGELYVAQDQNFRIVNVDLLSGAFSVTAIRRVNGVQFGNIRDMTVAGDGALWVLCYDTVSRIDPITGTQGPLYSDMYNGPDQLYNPFNMVIEPSGTMLRSFVGTVNPGDGGITRLVPATGIETVLVSGMDNPGDMAIGEDGSIFVLEEERSNAANDTRIVRIDPVDGTETLVTDSPLLGPAGEDLAWVPGYGLFKVNYVSHSILRIDVTTGEVSTLASFSENLGWSMAVIPEPATFSLLTVSIMALRRCRRRS